MSYTRMNYIEYVSDDIADEIEKHYTINGLKNFPDALCLVFLRTGATTATLTSFYPSKEAYDRATEQRKKGMKSHEGKIKSVKTEEGIASTFVVKQSPPKIDKMFDRTNFRSNSFLRG